jgi:hypothetical protein
VGRAGFHPTRHQREVAYPRAAPANNGMHPTADTPAVIYFQICGAAGDAGRYTALQRGYNLEAS